MLDRRLQGKQKKTDLPVDYTKMVREVLERNFDAGLKALAKIRANPRFEVTGAIYGDEILLVVSVCFEKGMTATTFYASGDFDPKASSPKAEDVLAMCLDGIGMLVANFLDPSDSIKLRGVAGDSAGSLNDAPIEWTEVQVNKRKVYLRMDKANPKLDQATDEWLDENDPDRQKQADEDQTATEAKFVTGPKDESDSD